MNINLQDHNYFRFSWIDAPLENIEKYMTKDYFVKNGYRVKHSQNIDNICFDYNPKIRKAYFVKMTNGIIMIPNLQDGWITLFHNITSNLKFSGYCFAISSKNETEPYNCITYVENGLTKRVCYVMKENKKWIFYEEGEILFFEDVKNYENKFKKDKLDQNTIINYLHKLKIVNNSVLEIQNNMNILVEHGT